MKFSKQDIIEYYKRNEFGYSLWGNNFHYGYWDETTKTNRQATENFNRVLAKQANITDKDHVLDAGCGIGGASIFLAKNYGCKVTGITICERQVKQAYAKAEKEGVAHLVTFKEMDYCNTTFEDETFDVVWGLESVCYAESKEKFVNESHRILKKGGRLIVGDGFASRKEYTEKERKQLFRWLDGWIVNSLGTPMDFKDFANALKMSNISYRNVTQNVMRSSNLMYYASLFFFVFHIIDKFFPLKDYPSDAMYNQHKALKQGLWEYGIFYAEK